MTKTNSDLKRNLTLSALISSMQWFHQAVWVVLKIWTFEFVICFGLPWCDSFGLGGNMSNWDIRTYKSKMVNTRSGPGISNFVFRIYSSSVDSHRTGRTFSGPPL